MSLKKITQLAWILAVAGGVRVAVATTGPDSAGSVSEMVREAIAQRFPGARIDLGGSIDLRGFSPTGGRVRAEILSESAPGQAQFVIKGAQSGEVRHMGTVSFSAWMPAWVALKRIPPNERLSADVFVQQEVNVADGQARDLRGMILGPETQFGSLETRQTILEGNYALSNAVVKTPDVRRGDAVRIRLTAGGVVLSTTGTASEPGYLENSVRVITSKGKRELVGRLIENGTVEVRL